MAKLPVEKFQHENQAGEKMAFTAAMSVDSDGTFHAVIPDELAESANAMRHPGAAVSHSGRTNWRVSGKRLWDVRDFIQKAMAAHLACEVTTERVIAYGYKLDVAYATSDAGNIFPNGYGAAADSGKLAASRGGYQWHGNLNGTQGGPLYTVGLGARVFDMVTYSRPTGKKIVYERVGSEKLAGTPGELLNSFCGLTINAKGSEIMPYSDEAAAFFYDAMIAMCRLADRMQDFMGSRAALLLAIEQRAGFLLPAPAGDGGHA